MTTPPTILDRVLSIIQNQIEKDEKFGTSDPLLSNPTESIGLQYCVLTILLDETPIAICGITNPNFAVRNTLFEQTITRRAISRKTPFLLLSNLRETILVETPHKAEVAGEVLRNYPLLNISNIKFDELTKPETIEIENQVHKVLNDLAVLNKDGRLFMEIPDADYFVARLVRAVNVLKPATKNALMTEISIKPDFAKELSDWAVPQGIPVDLKSEQFAEAVVTQAIYRLLGKIIFYQSLRRARPDLPELTMENLDTSQVLPRLYNCFAKAHEIDYHAVFRDDIIDRLPFPSTASAELRNLVEDLNTRDFAHLPQDVVGAVFERLIPPEDRHALGQFFTPEPLVDLITGFCVRNADDKVLDPTCGTGTFLIRSYNKLQTSLGVHDHSRLLSQLWGVDIAPFPAELATINLFRQQVEDAGNFPRVLNEDFFQIDPNGSYRFPPLKADHPTSSQVDEKIPQFDAIVGNFPYISADRIDQAQRGYLKKIIYPRLISEWFSDYPNGFAFSELGAKKEYELALEQGLSLEKYESKVEPDLSSFSDFYLYLFWHAAAFLKPGGRMGIVTSNAWLDVGFGYGLQKFFLNNFKIIAILESRCEPWFEQAAVNTVVTIIERCESQEERDTQPARFVKIKQPLNQLIPWDMHHDGLNRWLGIQHIVHLVETVWQTGEDIQQPYTWENESIRVRSIRQRALRVQLESTKKTMKWGQYLRSPDVYFDILFNSKNKFTLLNNIASPNFGSKTGINEFFHINEEKNKIYQIEEEFLFPLLKSPGDSDRILVDLDQLKLKVFICRLTKEELNNSGKKKALRYIEWGEKQTFKSGAQIGLTWPYGAEVKGRKPGWYSLPGYRSNTGQVFISRAFGERHITKLSLFPVISDARLFFLSPQDGISSEIIAAVLNSSIMALHLEVTGRVSLGDGALELSVEDARDYLVLPDIRKFTSMQNKNIVDKFQSLLSRSIGSVFDEIQKEDRKALDIAVLEALELDPNVWLQKIYSGLTSLVSDRLNLAKKRSQSRKTRSQKASGKVMDEVVEELLPDGPRHFPEDFYSISARAGKFNELQIPTSPLRYAGPMFGKEELITEEKVTIQVNNRFEVQFMLFAQAAGHSIARIPVQPVECSRTVNEYKKYLRDLRKQFHEAYFRRTLDQTQADRLTSEAWRKLALPILEE
jgi:methylase of polypeptide subunit release factors